MTCVLDPHGQVLARARIADGIEGLARLHALLASHTDDPAGVVAGTETDRGLLVGALVAAGYQVYAVNPLQVSRYRERHGTSRAKSDRGDAQVLADLVRTDRHHHRQVAGDSPKPRRSRSWPAPTRRWSGPASARPTSCAAPAGVLPRRTGRVRHRAGQPRGADGPGRRTHPHPGPHAHPG